MSDDRGKSASWFDAQIPAFIATEPFGPWHDSWAGYVQWSGLTQLKELVSLDAILCRTLLPDTKDEYWPHIVNEDFALDYFTNLEFLLKQTSAIAQKNTLCVFRNPPVQPNAPSAPLSFEFLGYDLVEGGGGVSALTNCGGFPDAFGNDELSPVGLIATRERAAAIQRDLARLHPNETHAQCHIWAIFRALP